MGHAGGGGGDGGGGGGDGDGGGGPGGGGGMGGGEGLGGGWYVTETGGAGALATGGAPTGARALLIPPGVLGLLMRLPSAPVTPATEPFVVTPVVSVAIIVTFGVVLVTLVTPGIVPDTLGGSGFSAEMAAIVPGVLAPGVVMHAETTSGGVET